MVTWFDCLSRRHNHVANNLIHSPITVGQGHLQIKRATIYADLVARLIWKTALSNHDWTMGKVARNMFLVAIHLIKPRYMWGGCELVASSCFIENSVSAFNGEYKRTSDISLSRIDTQGLKLHLSLAHRNHCSYASLEANWKTKNRKLFPLEKWRRLNRLSGRGFHTLIKESSSVLRDRGNAQSAKV